MKNFTRREFVATVATATVGATALANGVVAASPSRPTALDEFVDYDALGLAKLVKSKQASPKELLEASIRRVEALDGTLNALTTRLYERAMDRAATISPDSPFAGVPTLLKDTVDVEGVRRTDGSKLFLTRVGTTTAPYIKALEKAGLNPFGLTNQPELAAQAITDNEAFGPTRNPWELERTPMGSTGGGAVAVAAGYTPIVHGTDGGGSNRMPPHACGILGMKPTRGRMVPGEGTGEHDFFRTHQALSRTVRDNAKLAALTEDPSATHLPPMGWVEGPSKNRLRIAMTTVNFFGTDADPTVKEAIEKTATLCEELGHSVEIISNPVNGHDFYRAYEAVLVQKFPYLADLVENLTGLPIEQSGLLTKSTATIANYASTLPDDAAEKGMAYIHQLTAEHLTFHEKFDIFLTPVVPHEAPMIGDYTYDVAYEIAKERMQALMSFTPVANALGAPAMSVPLFWSSVSGQPIGSHFQAKAGNDRMLYELAYELEEARPWKDKWAPFSAKFIPV
ncbi:amidase [Rhodobacteraceae bacterium RKSG542]|uniref:amidase family protein n=1 Tax=Pseudovibrio flavus TaxID=2529854 RepID=UPI0012BD53FE|nr:amidase family protein [Pseudovibrio flavus]MTI16027.1 amidase [Pseudovibrio flavus]